MFLDQPRHASFDSYEERGPIIGFVMLGMRGWVCGLITLKEVGSGCRYEACHVSRLSRTGKAVPAYVSTCDLVARPACIK
jgi:hypothetical protein